METIQIAHEIEQKIQKLAKLREYLREYATLKATATAMYEKEIALTLIKLKNGQELELEDETIQNPPASIMDKLARGLCWKQRLGADKADAFYKGLIVTINTVESELNGYQSIFKFQTTM